VIFLKFINSVKVSHCDYWRRPLENIPTPLVTWHFYLSRISTLRAVYETSFGICKSVAGVVNFLSLQHISVQLSILSHAIASCRLDFFHSVKVTHVSGYFPTSENDCKSFTTPHLVVRNSCYKWMLCTFHRQLK